MTGLPTALHRPRLALAALLATLAASTGPAAAAGVADEITPQAPAATNRVLTSFHEIYLLPAADRNHPWPIRTSFLVYYFDPDWNAAWGECEGSPMFLPVGDSPQPAQPGKRYRLDGWIDPVANRIDWTRSRLEPAGTAPLPPPIPVSDLAQAAPRQKFHRVVVEGFVDRKREDRRHVSLSLVCGKTTATAFIVRDAAEPSLALNQGDFVRLTGVLSPQFDPNGDLVSLDLWITRAADVETLGSMEKDPRFDTPATAIEQIRDTLPPSELVHVRGVVRNHEAGKWVCIWDETGEVLLQSLQTMPVRPGEQVEAVGYPSVVGIHRWIQNGFYRRNPGPQPGNAAPHFPHPRPLRLAAQVRDMGLEEAGTGVPVRLWGMVAVSDPELPYAFIQDSSGGIRVMNPQWTDTNTAKIGTLVEVDGVTAAGDFVPVITNATFRRTGYWNPHAETPETITLDQAMSGSFDGRLVAMRGYVRRVTVRDRINQIEMFTPGGEFDAWVSSTRSWKHLEGSSVRLQGICSTIANSRHQLTGVQLLLPQSTFILEQDPQAADVFATPLRRLGSLRQYNPESALDARVRSSGIVLLHEPGRYLYLQDGADGLFALSRQTDPLQPGDRVEVVGFPGRQNQRFLMQETAYRKTAAGPEPTPISIGSRPLSDPSIDGLLARAEGTLLNVRARNKDVRMQIQTADFAMDATLEKAADANPPAADFDLPIGSRVALTGVYEVQQDEYGKPRAGLLHLRSWKDVTLLKRPPWWNLTRLLWALMGVLALTATAISWGLVIAHKNRLLGDAQAQLQSANDSLEHRVRERTRELQEQVVAKERARHELAEAQEELMLTSRRAGMAEVATGVLHNVGNVLNSVNVSAAMLGDRIRRLSIESVSKTAALLQSHRQQLGTFLSDNPKGKALPAYLEKLGAVLAEDKQEMLNEVQSLAKNIEHIKVIVSMQQSYAKIGGSLEEIDPKDLVEDAFQINSASLDRHAIQVLRDYHPAPRVLTDRHKVLQILVNLISNAKHALNQDRPDRKIILGVASSEPGRVAISITDTGMGIPRENLERIFSRGFTTRRDGHGFGLHSGALAAKELGGTLNVRSDGPGRGATFTLELPSSRNTGRLVQPAETGAEPRPAR
ncbi:MAG: ATP-binding protein [Verrucomicrobiota bacterium]